jgi:nucleoside-diphosphate-sugar epimerase
MFAQTSLLDCCADENFNIIRGDVRDEKLLCESMKDSDYIIPLAALVGFPLCEKCPDDAVSVNLDAVKCILKLRSKNQRIIFPCTNSGYGTGMGDEYCTEDSPLKPISLYGKTKVEAEHIILESGNSLTFRFATLFGSSPRMRMDLLVNDFVYKAVFDGKIEVFEGNFKRNFLHVHDAANAFVFAMENFEKMQGKAYNCGLSDTNISKLELCARIKNHIPNFQYTQGEGNDPDKRNYIVSNSRIEKAGWKAEKSLDSGIEELIKVYKISGEKRYGNV